jgi:VanZ family protein
MSEFCPSHDSFDKAIRRQEEILEAIRKNATEHQLYMAKTMGEFSTKIHTLAEIKSTLREHNQRREDDTRGCEDKRAEIWVGMNALKTRMDRRDGVTAIVAGVCTAIGATIAIMVNLFIKH